MCCTSASCIPLPAAFDWRDGMGMPQDAARRSGTSLVHIFVCQASKETSRQVDGGTRDVIRFEVLGSAVAA